ncbi:hypothetical protein HY620_00545 [Candidatus Uhrbacteria bacterium]|nr:hypothetical protein [Candidatus Uhrbacteria bacterium]
MKIRQAARMLFALSGILLSACNLSLPVNIGEVTGAKVDTVETNVDTKPVATATQKQNGGEPTVAPTLEQKKPLVLRFVADYSLLSRFTTVSFGGRDALHSYYVTAIGGTISYTPKYTAIGTAINDDTIMSDIRQVEPNGFTTKPGLTHGSVEHTTVIVPEDRTINIQLWPVMMVTDFKKYNGLTVGFMIQKKEDIKVVEQNVTIEGDFPIKTQEYPFCCYSEN